MVPSAPSWQFLYNALKKGADVEILLGVGVGFYVTLTGFHFNDANNDNIMENGEARISYFDANTGEPGQSSIWNTNGMIETDYSPGCFITMAASESPVPLPSSLFLFGSGLLGLWGVRRKISRRKG